MNTTPTTGRGIALPFLPAVIVVTAALAWFIGWPAVILALVLLAVSIGFAMWQERPQPPTPGAHDEDNPVPFADGRCRTCRCEVFHVQFGQTSAAEIAAFASEAEGWKDNPDALAGYMHPGIYCPNGCCAVLVEPVYDNLPPGDPVFSGSVTEALASFTDLLEAAGAAPGDDIYAAQDALIATCRAQRTRFLATMPMRHRYQCAVCAEQHGEAALHYEDPAATPAGPAPRSRWGEPTGRFCDIRRSVLHRVLTHDEPAPPSLVTLIESLR